MKTQKAKLTGSPVHTCWQITCQHLHVINLWCWSSNSYRLTDSPVTCWHHPEHSKAYLSGSCRSVWRVGHKQEVDASVSHCDLWGLKCFNPAQISLITNLNSYWSAQLVMLTCTNLIIVYLKASCASLTSLHRLQAEETCWQSWTFINIYTLFSSAFTAAA